MIEKLSAPALARKTVENFIANKTKLNAADYKVIDLIEDTDQAGAFVSIKLKNGDLRGCIGTIFPTKDTIEAEIVANAISAATQDPRFNAVKPDELSNLVYSVDIMGKPEPVNDISQLDPLKYGIIVKDDSGRQALLLPNLEGVDTIEKQLSITKNKAGISPRTPVSVFRFKADRYRENGITED